MNDKSNKEYAVSLFYAYTGRTAYKDNSRNNGIGVANRITRTLYNAYGFCLYTIQEFYDTNNRYPNLMEGTPDYTWCINYLRSKLNNIHRRITSMDLYCNTGDLYIYINDDGKYVIHNGDACHSYNIMYVSQPTQNIYGRNFKI